MIKSMILAIMIAPSTEATTASTTVLTTEIGPGDDRSKGYNYKKHYRKQNSRKARRRMRHCHMPR
jgi:hypothetical protein